MLQLPHESTPRALRIHPSRKAIKKKPLAKLSTLERAIADHKAKARLYRNRLSDEQRLHDAHPELADCRPSIHFWTSRDGKQHHGCCLIDFNRVFPPQLDRISPGNVKARKKFLADLEAAYPEHQRLRRRAGITRAESRRYEASRSEYIAFQQFIKIVPTTRSEIGRYTRYLLLATKGKVGGGFCCSISTTRFDKLGISFEDYKERQKAAFGYLYAAVSALARRGTEKA
jgi:hypothetical protein